MNVETIEANGIQPAATPRPFQFRRLIPKARQDISAVIEKSGDTASVTSRK